MIEPLKNSELPEDLINQLRNPFDTRNHIEKAWGKITEKIDSLEKLFDRSQRKPDEWEENWKAPPQVTPSLTPDDIRNNQNAAADNFRDEVVNRENAEINKKRAEAAQQKYRNR